MIPWSCPGGVLLVQNKGIGTWAKMCSVGRSLWTLQAWTSFQIAPRDPQLRAAVHPHLSSWIWALSSSVLPFYLQGMAFMTFHAVRCAGTWASVLLRSVGIDTCVTILSWVSFPNTALSTTWQLSVSAGQNQNIQFWRQFWATNKRERKKYIYIYVYVCVNKPCLFFAHFLMWLWSTLLFPKPEHSLQAFCCLGLGGLVWHCCLHCRKPALAAC